jgi:hypothetical protein
MERVAVMRRIGDIFIDEGRKSGVSRQGFLLLLGKKPNLRERKNKKNYLYV